MKKIKLLALLLVSVLSINLWGAPGDHSSVSFAEWMVSCQTYSSTEWSDNGCTFTYAANNNKGWSYLGVGGKSTATSTIKYNTKLTVPISKVTLNISGITNGSSSSITVNSITATAYSDANFSTQVGVKSLSNLNYTTNSCPASVEISPETVFPANSYIKISISFTCTGTKNSRLQVTSIDFYEGAASTKTLSSIAITAEPKKTYTTCETLDLTDCVVTATYSDGSKDDVTSQCTFNPANGAALTTDVTSVLVSYGGKNATIENISVEEGKQDTFIDNIQGNEITYGVCSYSVPTLDSKSAAAPTGDCEDDHYKFIGWTTGSYSSGITATNQLENFIEGDAQNTATGKTYYAVWAKEAEE